MCSTAADLMALPHHTAHTYQCIFACHQRGLCMCVWLEYCISCCTTAKATKALCFVPCVSLSWRNARLCCILAVTYYAPQLIKLCTLICKPLQLRRFPLGSCLPALVLFYTQAELCKPLRSQTRATTPLTAAYGAAVGDGKLCGLPAGTCEL